MQKTIQNLYLEFLWNYFNDNNFILYTVKGYYYFNVYDKTKISLLSGHGNHNYIKNEIHRESIKNNKIISLEEFIKEANNQKKWFINGLTDFYQILIDFYIKLSPNYKLKIGVILNKFKLDSRFDIFKANKLLLTKSSYADFKIWWSNTPNSFTKISVHSTLLSDIVSFLDNNVEKSKHDELLADLLIKKKIIINKSEQTSLLIKNFLINRYVSDNKKLYKFKGLPIIDSYLQRKENYLDSPLIKESIYLEVDIDRLKAYASIDNWTTHTYNKWLNALFKVIWKESAEIEKIRSYTEKSKDKNFLSVYINKIEKKGLSKKNIEKIIKDFFNYLIKSRPELYISHKEIEAYISKWYLSIKLNQELHKNKIKLLHKI